MLPPGLSGQMVREMLNNLVTSQSLMLATNGLMMVIGAVFIIASVSIVLAPKAVERWTLPRSGIESVAKCARGMEYGQGAKQS